MIITEYFESDNQNHWLEEIGKCEWRAGKHLYEYLRDHRLKDLCGKMTKVLLLTDGDVLVSFCTYAEKDDIPDSDLKPWIGFVYTFPEYRGHRYIGRLLAYAESLAARDGFEQIYISTGEEGLYEKYGYEFYGFMKDRHGEDSRIYIKKRYNQI